MMDDGAARAIVADVKRELQRRDGAAAAHAAARAARQLRRALRLRRSGSSNYGTAGYLGNGYFITVKHGVVALGQDGVAGPRKITRSR